jgi:hypothetical protein
MARPGYRVRLENGLKLDLYRLVRKGFIKLGCRSGSGIRWTRDGEEIASGIITADTTGENGPYGWLRIQIGNLDQSIQLIAESRHFGGCQWYFVCPYMNRKASVLWRPPGARYFASRQKWGRQVAYNSQFLDRDSRADRGKAKLSAKLCQIGGFDPEEWDFPPKPKWMRWKTYQRYEAKLDSYEAILDEGTMELIARLLVDKKSRKNKG